MEFTGKMRWGRTDPVTKTLSEIEKIIKKKNDLKWLSKRMMAKRGDDVAKAFAGSLHASHDEQFTMVGQFNSGSFGSGSYVRRGDGKPGYLAGIQNYANLTLRMLPWEDHAKRGMYFFSWEGGCLHGPGTRPPKDWRGCPQPVSIRPHEIRNERTVRVDHGRPRCGRRGERQPLQPATLPSDSTTVPSSVSAWMPWRRSQRKTPRSSTTSHCPCSAAAALHPCP